MQLCLSSAAMVVINLNTIWCLRLAFSIGLLTGNFLYEILTGLRYFSATKRETKLSGGPHLNEKSYVHFQWNIKFSYFSAQINGEPEDHCLWFKTFSVNFNLPLETKCFAASFVSKLNIIMFSSPMTCVSFHWEKALSAKKITDVTSFS